MSESQPALQKTLVWDAPARVSHWGFALSTSVSLWIGFLCDPESSIFHYHILAGIFALWFLALRILLGFLGSNPMRWIHFFHSPSALQNYLRDVWNWKTPHYPGLNPGSSWFALMIYLNLFAVLYSGWIPDLAETWHGFLALGILALIATHLLGLIFHAVRHRAWTPLAMIHGEDLRPRPFPALPRRNQWGLYLILISGVLGWALVHYFDSNTSMLAIPGLPEFAFPIIQKG